VHPPRRDGRENRRCGVRHFERADVAPRALWPRNATLVGCGAGCIRARIDRRARGSRSEKRHRSRRTAIVREDAKARIDWSAGGADLIACLRRRNRAAGVVANQIVAAGRDRRRVLRRAVGRSSGVAGDQCVDQREIRQQTEQRHAASLRIGIAGDRHVAQRSDERVVALDVKPGCTKTRVPRIVRDGAVRDGKSTGRWAIVEVVDTANVGKRWADRLVLRYRGAGDRQRAERVDRAPGVLCRVAADRRIDDGQTARAARVDAPSRSERGSTVSDGVVADRHPRQRQHSLVADAAAAIDARGNVPVAAGDREAGHRDGRTGCDVENPVGPSDAALDRRLADPYDVQRGRDVEIARRRIVGASGSDHQRVGAGGQVDRVRSVIARTFTGNNARRRLRVCCDDRLAQRAPPVRCVDHVARRVDIDRRGERGDRREIKIRAGEYGSEWFHPAAENEPRFLHPKVPAALS